LVYLLTRRSDSEVMRVAIEMNIEGKYGRPKKKWLDRIENDMKIAEVNKGER